MFWEAKKIWSFINKMSRNKKSSSDYILLHQASESGQIENIFGSNKW